MLHVKKMQFIESICFVQVSFPISVLKLLHLWLIFYKFQGFFLSFLKTFLIVGLFIFHREDYSFTAYATISYLKIGPKANLLNNEAHVITMQVKKTTQSCLRVPGY